jgi:electron transport complex protein RnfA
MGAAVTFVMLVSSMCAFGIHRALITINAPYLHLISYIVVIASAVQLVEMFIKRFSPALFRALGIFLPLITTNCAILGVALFQTNREYSFVQSLSFALGAGAGFTLALLLMSGLRERLELSDVSSVVRGAALTLMIAGILSMAFMGFAGMAG